MRSQENALLQFIQGGVTPIGAINTSFKPEFWSVVKILPSLFAGQVQDKFLGTVKRWSERSLAHSQEVKS